MAETALLLSRKAAELFADKGIENPRLEAELLLAHALGIRRLQLYLQFDRPVSDDELERFRGYVRRRLRREPVQYIAGSAHFRALELAVDARVLIPRPETEELVGLVLDWAWAQVGGRPAKKPHQLVWGGESGGVGGTAPGVPASAGEEASGKRERQSPWTELSPTPPHSGVEGEGVDPHTVYRRLVALDIGTGSGAIALSLLEEGPFERVVATDLSQDALAVARANAERLGLADRLELRPGSLWQALARERTFDVVASNPPYVAETERPELPPEVREWEPAGALFAGEAGFDVLGPLIAGAAAHLRPGGLLALEIGAAQAEGTLQRIEATGAFEGARVARDMAGRDRVALATRRGDRGDRGGGGDSGGRGSEGGGGERLDRVGESLAHEAERRQHA